MYRKLSLTSILAIAALVGAGVLWASTLPEVGWWKFDEPSGVVAFDATGFAHNGTLMGSAAFMPDPVMGNVLEIYGPSGEVRVQHSANFEPETGTVEVWVKLNVLQHTDVVRKTTDFLVNRQQAGEYYAYGLRVLRNGTVQAVICNDDLASSRWLATANTKAMAVRENQWVHLAMRWDGSMLSIFVDGKLAAAATYTPVPGTGLSYHGSSDLKFGAAWGDLEFNGYLSDARLY